MREIILDTETTGLDPASGHRIVEIGCVELVHRKRTGSTFHTYLNPERDMPQEAYRIHGIAGEFLLDKPLFKHVAEDFMAFIEGATLVIHNAAFDVKFLNAELKTAGHTLLSLPSVIDTLLLARKRFPGSPASLDALCKRFNVDLSSRTKHGALLDAELLAAVYIELTGGTQSSLSFSSATQVPTQENTILAKPKSTLATKHTLPTLEEEAAHQALLKKLLNPVWEEM